MPKGGGRALARFWGMPARERVLGCAALDDLTARPSKLRSPIDKIHPMPFPGLNIETERQLYYERHRAVLAYARANSLARAEVGAPGVESAQTPVAASHTSAFWIPMVVAIFGGIWGVLTTVILGNRSSSIHLTDRHKLLLGGLGLGVGAVAGIGTWLNQDVWTFWPNAVATALAGYTAATTGNTLALIRVASGQEDDRRQAAPAGPQTAPAGG